MSPLRARVHEGRLILDEPTTLPQGTVIDLVADDEDDNLTDNERRALHAALSESWTSVEVRRLRWTSGRLATVRLRDCPSPASPVH